MKIKFSVKEIGLDTRLFTNVQATKRFIKALLQLTTEGFLVKSWDEYQ